MEFHYTLKTSRSIPEAIAALETALSNRKFSVLWHLDIQSKLKEKGFDLEPQFHVLEVCSARHAKTALDTNLEVGYFLPCKMVVYAKDGVTHVGLLRPGMLMDVLGEPRLQALAAEVEATLREALEEAAAS